MRIADLHSIPVVEDAAQSIGSQYKSRPSGSIGNIGCFSAHPLKNLNAFGDAGFLTTNSKEIAEKAKLLSNHGLKTRDIVERFGFNSRMDTLQAVILNYHLDNLDNVIAKRRENASIYFETLNNKYVFFNKPRDYSFDTFHTFVIQVNERDALKNFLESKGVGTSIHYPIPIHLQPAASHQSHFLLALQLVYSDSSVAIRWLLSNHVSLLDKNYIPQNERGISTCIHQSFLQAPLPFLLQMPHSLACQGLWGLPEGL